jgi:hypothetical protein
MVQSVLPKGVWTKQLHNCLRNVTEFRAYSVGLLAGVLVRSDGEVLLTSDSQTVAVRRLPCASFRVNCAVAVIHVCSLELITVMSWPHTGDHHVNL